MIQLEFDLFVDIKTMIQLMKKALPKRKSIDRYMINKVHLRVKLQKRILNSKNAVID